MPVFEYKALTASGETRTGVMDADTPREARLKLKREALHVVNLRQIEEVAKASRISFANLFARKRQIGELAMVTRQLATLLQAGIPMAESLRAMIEQIETKRLETIFRDVREKVTQGSSFADALAQHPRILSTLYVNMVKAGEAAGNLESVLMSLAQYMLKQNRMRNKVQAALMYPMVMVFVGVIVVSVLMIFVVPKLLTLIKANKDAIMPLPTLILSRVSNFFASYWYLLLLGVIAVYLIVAAIRRTEKGRYSTDMMLLKLPIFGELFKKQAVSRFAVTLSTLLKSGVAVLESLVIVKKIVGNSVVEKVLSEVHQHILEGTDISSPLKKSGIFPPAVGYMVAVGEQSGELEGILETIAVAYDEEIEIATQKMTALLEPVLILIMALVVAFIVLAILMPMLQLSKIG
ncbi:MAG: type II secretion system F family protein [Planctomycetes bacterium]|nr:type II secretion system F family protein [Planctomycetota bacterium]